MIVKTVDELMQALILLQEADNASGDTELLLFGECIPGQAHNLDYLDVDMNGNMVQLFMRYK